MKNTKFNFGTSTFITEKCTLEGCLHLKCMKCATLLRKPILIIKLGLKRNVSENTKFHLQAIQKFVI